jgi:hypothetical protein
MKNYFIRVFVGFVFGLGMIESVDFALGMEASGGECLEAEETGQRVVSKHGVSVWVPREATWRHNTEKDTLARVGKGATTGGVFIWLEMTMRDPSQWKMSPAEVSELAHEILMREFEGDLQALGCSERPPFSPKTLSDGVHQGFQSDFVLHCAGVASDSEMRVRTVTLHTSNQYEAEFLVVLELLVATDGQGAFEVIPTLRGRGTGFKAL